MSPRSLGLCALIALACPAPGAGAQEAARKTVWDLRLGEPVSAQPDAGEYRGYSCGSNGGPPRQALSGFADYRRCPPEAGGLSEVYFEYDDELEYVARARDNEQDLNRYAGTAERGFPLIVSALIDEAGLLRGVRLVTDSRPDYRKDATEADLSKRANSYTFGGLMAGRFDIDTQVHCVKAPPAEGESAVGGLFIKLDCERTDLAARRTYKVSARLLRKPGQNGRDPRNPSQLTKGQFESAARLEILVAP